MKALFALVFLLAFPALAETVTITIPPGATSLELSFKKPVDAPEIATAVPLNFPAVRPDWCDDDAHACITDTQIHKVMWQYMQPSNSFEGEQKVGAECTAKQFPASVVGKLSLLTKYKSTETFWLCQPQPMGAEAFHIQLKPGVEHNIFLTAWAVDLGVIFSSPRGTLKADRPTVNCFSAINKYRNTGFESNACVGGRGIKDITVRGIVIRQSAMLDGARRHTAGKGLYYRCIQAPIGHTKVVDTDFVGCKTGLQGKGKTLEVTNSFIEAGHAGGVQHAAYFFGDVVVTNSRLVTCGGHALKTIAPQTTITDSTLISGRGKKCDSGTVFNNAYGGVATITNSTLSLERDPETGPYVGSNFVLSSGSGHTTRCTGIDGVRGVWTLKNVKLLKENDRDPAKVRVDIPTGCPDLTPSQWTDQGGNSFNGVSLF